jgi:C1A family cysteine protease
MDIGELETRTIDRYGWKPSPPDQRDFVADASEIKILPEVDPRSEMPPVFNQLDLGSCTAQAVAAAKEYHDRITGQDTTTGWTSRLFIYYGERMLEGTLGQGDTGAYGRDGFKWLRKIGSPPEEHWPYDITRFEEKPSQDAWQAAGAHRIDVYKAVPRSIRQMKAVLSNKQTIAFGFSVYESFESSDVAHTGVIPEPQADERMLGGHEVLMVGYLKSEPAHALVRNSWDTDWGLGGYCLFPWSMILDTNISSDFRTIYRPRG